MQGSSVSRGEFDCDDIEFVWDRDDDARPVGPVVSGDRSTAVRQRVWRGPPVSASAGDKCQIDIALETEASEPRPIDRHEIVVLGDFEQRWQASR